MNSISPLRLFVIMLPLLFAGHAILSFLIPEVLRLLVPDQLRLVLGLF